MLLSIAKIALAVTGLLPLLPTAIADSRERNPLSQVGRIVQPSIQTPSHRVHALSHFQLTFLVTFPLGDTRQNVRLSLEPNNNVIAPGATVTYLGKDGSIERSEPLNRLEYRVYKGRAFVQDAGQTEWTYAGWASIYVDQDGQHPLFEGSFALYGNLYNVHTSKNFRELRLPNDPEIEQTPDEYMVVWRNSDILRDNPDQSNSTAALKRALEEEETCNSDDLGYNVDENHPVYRGFNGIDKRSSWSSVASGWLFGRQIDGTTGGNSAGVNLSSTIGSTSGCPGARKVALIGVAADCTYTASFGGNETAVRANIIKQVGTASDVYASTFNISLGLQNLTVNPSDCPATANPDTPWNVGCSDSVGITDRLNLFSQWRGQHKDTNAYWTLMSTCSTGSAVGLAWLGQLCMTGLQTSSSGGSNETVAAANVVVKTSSEWQVFAHETGHTFGAIHDCTSSTCADGTATKQQCCPLSASTCDAGGQYIMNPSSGGPDVKYFSPCTIGNICSALGRQSVRSTCLTNNKDVVTITGSQCGNGIVEEGEECDCGGTEGCGDNSCCDAKTCKFTTGSVCDPSNEDCCTQQCGFASNGTVCRSSTGQCDPEETCTGSSAYCPADQNAADGTSCGGGLQCASGQCTSRDQQCKSLMGSLTTDNDTQACDTSSCQISCKSPQFGYNVCYTMNQNFLDGTSCEGGGKCSNGACQGANVGDKAKTWIEDNKNIVIPVACVVGIFIILAIVCCVWTTCRRVKRRRRGGGGGGGGGRPQGVPKPPPPGWASAPPPGWGPPPPPPQQQQQQHAPPAPMMSRGGGMDEGFPQDVPPPPPPYSDGGGHQSFRNSRFA